MKAGLVSERLKQRVLGERNEPAILARAIEVIGDSGEAMRWLGTPVRALGYATPISLLHNVKGRKSVIAVLTQLEHGVM